MRPPPHIRTALRALLCIGAAVGLGACVGEPQPAGPPVASRATFEARVYPILLRDCGFPACHGNADRFFRVYGPNRLRIDEEIELDAPPTSLEIDATYERARSMLASAESPDEALLLRKPLELDVGGAPHLGTDDMGRDVYRDREHPSWIALLEWAGGRAEATAPEDEGEEPSPTPEDGGVEDAPGEVDGGVSADGGGA